MNQWLNFSHPQTLQAGVFLGYLSAVFGVLRLDAPSPLPTPLRLVIFLAMGFSAFFTANNRRIGYQVLAITAGLIAATDVAEVALAIFDGVRVAGLVYLINRAVFPVALAAAVLHLQSRQYQKIWFE